jgi:hypothetical protein
MGVLEDQSRVLKSERDRLVQDVARQSTELERRAAELVDALAAREAVAKERDALVVERDAKPTLSIDTAGFVGSERIDLDLADLNYTLA